MRKGWIWIAALALVVSLPAALSFVTFSALARAPDGLPEEGLIFHVKTGEGAAALASRLEKEGVLRSALAFRLLAKLRAQEGELKAGSYRLEPGMGASELLRIIVSGKQALIKVTFPEGLTLSQTADLVETAGLAEKEEFLAAARDPELLSELRIPAPSAEGYLFPDTYLFPVGYGAAPTLRTMVLAFFKEVSALPGFDSAKAASLHERIILASIIEREYRLPEEAPYMASVFLNRLKIGMALQSCATVVYVITEKLKRPHPEALYDRDIRIPDPYNTYAQRGLPPGPISNPGITALSAALNPAKSPYLYFRLVDPATGRHHFSESLDEHNKAGSLAVKRASGR